MASSRKRTTASKGTKKKAAGKLAKVKSKVKAAVRSVLKPKKSKNTGSKAGSKKAVRPIRRESDVSAQELATRTPSQQSGKGPFDKNRAENQRDTEARVGVTNTNERFSEEDQYTNRTGDPRIGTRGRK
jgi:hypothetical protein